MSSLSPPPGGDQNQGPKIMIVQWVMTAMALPIVGARIFGRFRITRNAGLDDLWIVIAMVTCFFMSSLLGIHLLTLDANKVLQHILHIHVHSRRGSRKWKTSLLSGTGSNFKSHRIKHHSLDPRRHDFLNTQTRRRLSINEASKPQQMAEMVPVFFVY